MDPLLQQAEESLKAGDRGQAEIQCKQVLAGSPGHPGALRLMAVLRLQGGRATDAIPLLREALQAEPDSLDTLDALSAALMGVEDFAAAEAIVRRALALDENLPAAHMRLGIALASQDKWAEAAHVFQEVLARNPRLADAHYQLGLALDNLLRLAEAISCYRRALALNPGHPESHVALGHAFQDLGLTAAALARYGRALALDPSSAIAGHNLGIVRLLRQEFELGWPIYERRTLCPPVRARLRKDVSSIELFEGLPKWRGPGEAGVKNAAIWAEQGIGDQIVYSTLLPELAGAGIPVVYEVDHRLLAAYQRAFPGVHFVPIEDPPREPLRRASRVLLAGSLPALFRATRSAFARQPAKLLSALPERVAHYRALFRGSDSRLSVALSWKSTRSGASIQGKSAPLAEFASLLSVPGVRFVDVQYGDTRDERGAVEQAGVARLLHFDKVDYFNDLEEVLAILEVCDLVITTSNATAHLAGAIGKRTWLLYPRDNPPFHYWATDENRRSLWYPSVEIISSARLASWRSLGDEAASRLREEASPGTFPIGEASAADDWLDRARTLRLAGRLDEAVALARHELERTPRDARAWSELAHALRWQGNLSEARIAATRAVEIAPAMAGAWFNLGAARVESGETADGIQAYRKAVELEPGFAEAWSNLGGALAAAGDAAGEVDAYFRAVGANPALAPVWSNLGNALLEAGEIDEALAACRRAVALDPHYAPAWSNLGNALREQGENGEAIRACRRAIELSPEMAEAWSNLGSALMEQSETQESLAAHRRALTLSPRNARAHYNLGLAEERRDGLEAAAARYRAAVEIDPAFAAAGVRLACVMLTGGNFAEGWPEYERRWLAKSARPKRYAFAPWAGERVPGGRLLVWGEQGLGDELIYATMIGELVDAGLQVTLEIDPRLVSLMQRSFPKAAVVARTDPPALAPGDFEWQCPLGSLGRWLRPAFGAFPTHAGYLKPDAARARAFAARLRSPGPACIVGVSWSSANREAGLRKSIVPIDWTEILRVPGARFVDLQYGDTRSAREALQRAGLEIIHLDDLDLFNDLEGLAALCAACDLVITTSNVTAHMAGAIGKPVWLLAPTGTGRIWYWFSGRGDSPWYPSMRVYAQQRPGSWREPLAAVARDLAALVQRPEPTSQS